MWYGMVSLCCPQTWLVKACWMTRGWTNRVHTNSMFSLYHFIIFDVSHALGSPWLVSNLFFPHGVVSPRLEPLWTLQLNGDGHQSDWFLFCSAEDDLQHLNRDLGWASGGALFFRCHQVDLQSSTHWIPMLLSFKYIKLYYYCYYYSPIIHEDEKYLETLTWYGIYS